MDSDKCGSPDHTVSKQSCATPTKQKTYQVEHCFLQLRRAHTPRCRSRPDDLVVVLCPGRSNARSPASCAVLVTVATTGPQKNEETMDWYFVSDCLQSTFLRYRTVVTGTLFLSDFVSVCLYSSPAGTVCIHSVIILGRAITRHPDRLVRPLFFALVPSAAFGSYFSLRSFRARQSVVILSDVSPGRGRKMHQSFGGTGGSVPRQSKLASATAKNSGLRNDSFSL